MLGVDLKNNHKFRVKLQNSVAMGTPKCMVLRSRSLPGIQMAHPLQL